MSKRKYLVLYRNQRSGGRSGPSPEQMQQMFAAFNAWKEKFKDAILDIGAKLESEGRVVTASGVADGPFVGKSSPLPVVIIVRRWGGVRRSGGIAWTPEARQSNHSSWKANG